MDVQAIVFDVNGTMVEIWTEDDREDIFRAAGHFLTYQGIDLRRHRVRDLYFEIMKRQQAESSEQYPEFDAIGIWRTIVEDHMTDYTRALPADKLAQLPAFLAEMYRGMSRRHLGLYPHVRAVLEELRARFRLAIVTDGQSGYARGELQAVGLTEFFDPIVISGDHGFRKPDGRLFQIVLDSLGVPAESALYVGNDMYRDIYGAGAVGMRTVMFDSDQGAKHYQDCTPDYRITDFRQLLHILGTR